MKLIFLLIAAYSLTACAGRGDKHSEGTDAPKEENLQGAEARDIQTLKPVYTSLETNVSNHITKIFEEYFRVKSALVNSSSIDAKNAATSLNETLNNLDKSLLTPEQLQSYNKEVTGLKASSNLIANTNDLDKQREHFSALSLHAYGLAKSFGAGKTVYHDHCPMAFDNKGAMWLSEEKAIKNPFFGEKMMKCGSVEEVIE